MEDTLVKKVVAEDAMEKDAVVEWLWRGTMWKKRFDGESRSG